MPVERLCGNICVTFPMRGVFSKAWRFASPIGSKRCDAFRETEIRLAATAGLNCARLNGAFRHGLAAGDRVNLNRPVGDASRPLLP